MDRKSRHQARRNAATVRLNDDARALQLAMSRAGIPANHKQRFLNWAIASLWDGYNQERMNKRIIIENEIKSLGLRLPNGTVKKDYHATLKLPLDRIFDVELLGADELGLSTALSEEDTLTVSGRPMKTGDFTLRLSYRTDPDETPSELQIPVAFNPNPRDLWKNIPTPEDVIFYKPDSATEYLKVEAGLDGMPRKDIVAASQRGRSHAQEGKPRDDHFRLWHSDGSDWYVIAVADGAGSARYSRRGSWVACDAVIDHCSSLLNYNPDFETAIREFVADRGDEAKRTHLTRDVIDIVYTGAMKAHEAVKRVAQANEGSQLKDFATTLMFAICKRFEFGWFIASFWVGDGAMCLYDEESGTAKLLGTPDEGEFSGQTRFLTMPEIFRDPDVVKKRLRMTIVPDFTALFLMSDGVSDPMFETDRNLGDYDKWKEFYERLKSGFPEDEIGGVELSDDNEASKDQLLRWLDFWSPGNHDDRTIAILY